MRYQYLLFDLDGTITDAKTQAAVLKVYIKAKG